MKLKDQPILKLVINPYLIDINFSVLVSRLWLPSLYKIGMYRGLKQGKLEIDRSLIFTLLDRLLHGLGDLNNISIGEHGSRTYSHKSGFRLENEVFYFLRKDQDKVYLWNMVREFFKVRGLNIDSNCISIEKLHSGFAFSRWYLRFRMSKGISILPNSISWNKHKKELIYTLKKEQMSADLKIKKLQSILLTWIQSNNFCSKVKLKASCFYFKRLLAKYN
jgi:hypothetical protein